MPEKKKNAENLINLDTTKKLNLHLIKAII